MYDCINQLAFNYRLHIKVVGKSQVNRNESDFQPLPPLSKNELKLCIIKRPRKASVSPRTDMYAPVGFGVMHMKLIENPIRLYLHHVESLRVLFVENGLSSKKRTWLFHDT